MKKIEDLGKQDYKNFFEWILDRPVKLDGEIDFSLCHTHEDPYVYYPEEIGEFLKTRPMQRLKRVQQLGTEVIENPIVAHTRYNHCLGTYNNTVLFFMMQYQNPDWKNEIEKSGRKIEILANIMEALRHDDGHNILSHALESLIGQDVGAHELLGARFKSENKETIDAINKIHPDLLQKMNEVSSPDYSLIHLREGNIDVDRLDYLSRDILYLGYEETRYLTDKLLSAAKIEKAYINGVEKEIIVYSADDIRDIEQLLKNRLKLYKTVCVANTRSGLDSLQELFCKKIMESNTEEGKELKQYIKHCTERSIYDIDLEEFLSWNDLRFYNQVIDIAQNSPNQNLRELAIACLPNIEGLCNLAIEMIDPKNVKPEDYSEDDREFIKNVKAIMDPNHPLHDCLDYEDLSRSFTILNASKPDEIANVLSSLIKKGLSRNDLSNIKIWHRPIKVHNSKEPIYVKGADGRIYTLESHPDLNMNLSTRLISGGLIIPALCRENGMSEESIDLVQKAFDDFNESHPIKKAPHIPRMRDFQIVKEPHLLEYREK